MLSSPHHSDRKGASLRIPQIALAFIACLTAFSATAGPTISELVKQHDGLTTATSVEFKHLVLTSGRLKLTFPSAIAAEVKAGDRTVGIFLKGDGAFQYTIDDAVEYPIAKANLKNVKSKATATSASSGLVVSAEVSEVLWIAPAGTLPEIKGAAGPEIQGHLGAQRQVFNENRGTQSALLFALQQLNGGDLVRAEMRGSEEWVYTFDGVNTRTESLSLLYTVNFDDRSRRKERFEAIIAEEPIGRDRREPGALSFSLAALDFEITASDTRSVKIVVTETIVARRETRAFWFGLFDTIHIPGEDTPRTMHVRGITGADGSSVDFVHRHNELVISLPGAIPAGRAVKLTFDLEGDILHRPSGDNYWILRGHWYPTPDKAGESATIHGVVKVKAPFIPFTGGRTVSRRSEGGYNMVETVIDRPVQYIAVVAGKYHFEEEKRKNLTVRTASYGMKNSRAIKKLTALAFDMVGYYEFFLGPFPLDELNIIEINDFGWGQAPPGLVFITSEAFQPILGEVNQLYSEGINERFAHEIAHQYWGTAVKTSSYDEQWLEESFAEYSAALLLKKFQGEAVYNRLVRHWRGNARVATNTAPIPLANRIVMPGIEDELHRIFLLYSKGPLLLSSLHKQVGDETFLTFLKSYQKNFQGKFGTTKDVAGLLGFLARKDFRPFFEQYYWGTALP